MRNRLRPPRCSKKLFAPALPPSKLDIQTERNQMSDAEEWIQTELPLGDQEIEDKAPGEQAFCWPDVAPTLTASSRDTVVLQLMTRFSAEAGPGDPE